MNCNQYSRFDPLQQAAWKALCGIQPHEDFGLTLNGQGLAPCDVAIASKQGKAVWMHTNGLAPDAKPKKAKNVDIRQIRNVTLDAEWPENPEIAHAVGKYFKELCIAEGLMHPDQPQDNSGAGPHFILPIPAIEVTADTAEDYNTAVSRVVRNHYFLLWHRACMDLKDVGGMVLLNGLGGFDISRVMSPAGTWRPTNPNKPDCDALKPGVLRTWQPPYVDGNYPQRQECQRLRDLILEEYDTWLKEKKERLENRRTKYNGRATNEQEAWLVNYYKKHPMPQNGNGEDRSAVWHTLIAAILKKYKSEGAVYDLAECLNELTGHKYEGRISDEISRSLSKMEQVKEEQEEERQYQQKKDGLPDIVLKGQLRDQLANCLHALRQANERKLIMFTHLSSPSVIALDDERKPYILRMGSTELRNELTFAANFLRLTETGLKAMLPPRDLAEQILGLAPSKWPVPPLKALVEAPVLRPDGSILDQPGYDEATKLYYYPSKEMRRCTIPTNPTQADARKAMEFLRPIFADFPFEGDSDHANAFGALFTPFVRYAIKGDVQMALLDATNSGVGKGKIIHVISITATGSITAPTAAKNDDTEWRKAILSVLRTGPRIVIIDNIRGVLESAALDLILTSSDGGFSERILGESKNAKVKNEATWLATGNNLLVGGDLARRCYRIRLLSQTSRPDERDPSTFQIPNLEEWILKHRSEVVAAILTICRAWFVAGSPQSTGVPFMGDFSHWAKTVGGILEFAGVMGFQGNRDALRSRNSDEAAEWEVFLETWDNLYGSEWKTAAEVTEPIKKYVAGLQISNNVLHQPPASPLFEVLPKYLKKALTEKPNSFDIVLGIQLGKRKQTVYGSANLRIEDKPLKHDGKQLWRVVRVVAGGSTSQPRARGKNNTLDDNDNKYPENASEWYNHQQPPAEQNGNIPNNPSIGSNTVVHSISPKDAENAFAGGSQKIDEKSVSPSQNGYHPTDADILKRLQWFYATPDYQAKRDYLKNLDKPKPTHACSQGHADAWVPSSGALQTSEWWKCALCYPEILALI